MKKLLRLSALPLLAGAAFGASVAPQPSFRASFDGTLEAECRGAKAAVHVEGPVEFRAGKFGKALLCGEGGATLEYATAKNLRAASGTVSLWVCPLDWTGAKDTFHVFFEAKDPGWLVLYRYYQSGITMLAGTDGKNYSATVGPRIAWKPGEWHHIAGTWRATGLAVYVDGKRVGFRATPKLPPALSKTFRIGDHPWHVPRKQQTLVDEVRVYPMPLDAADIAALAVGKEPTTRPRPVVQLDTDPEAGTLTVQLDTAGWVGDGAPGESARVQLIRGDSKKPLVSRAFPGLHNDTAQAVIPIAALPPGKYSLHTEILDKNGKPVTALDTPFAKPGPPVWRGNRIGLEDTVLPPWTPLRRTDVDGTPTFYCWGRQYAFGPFLASAESAGKPLLATPVRLEAVIGGKPIRIAWTACAVKSASATQAVLSCAGTGGGMKFSVRRRIEFDGLTWCELSVAPESGNVRVDALRLVWSMPAAQASLIHADDLGWYKNTTGRLPETGWKSPGGKRFTDYFWLGNEDAGLAWFRESEQYWVSAPDQSALQAVPKGDAVDVTVRFIAAPAELTAARTYRFGFMATPVRPRPGDARRWRMTPAKHPTMEIVWPNGHMTYYGYTEPIDPERFRKRVQDAHRQGRLVIPYVNLNYLSKGVPEWLFYHKTWEEPGRAVTPSDVAAMGYPSMGMSPAVKDWQDFILYRIREMIRKYEVDGIYIDCWTPYPSLNPACAWEDAKGKPHPTHPILAYRQILRRVYALFRKMRPHPLLQVHMSSHYIIPMLSFTDTTLDGEQFRSSPLKADYLEYLHPDAFRAEFMGRNWGPVAFFLPELPKAYQAEGTFNLAVYLLLHDINAWPIWSDGKQWGQFYGILDRFGIPEARFLPYWTPTGATVSGPSDVLVSAFARKGKVLLAVMNTGKKKSATLRPMFDRLGIKPDVVATDPSTGKRLPLGPTGITVPLARHQGRLVLLEGPAG